MTGCRAQRTIDLHLRVEQASGPLNNGDSLVVGGDSKDGVLRVPQDSPELKTEISGVKVGGESVGHGLLGPSRDLNGVLLRSKVAHNLGLAIDFLRERATNNAHTNWLGLVVGDGQTGLGGMTVNQLDAEDLRLRERGRYLDIQVRCLDFGDFFHVLNLSARGSAN